MAKSDYEIVREQRKKEQAESKKPAKPNQT
jgi:hypothetical protein